MHKNPDALTSRSSNLEAADRGIAYRKVAEDLRQRIKKGDFTDGVALPTEAQLAESYNLSRQTVRRALLDLVGERLIYRIAGKGTFVSQKRDRFVSDFSTIGDLLTISADSICEVLKPFDSRLDPFAARQLRLEGDGVMSIALRRVWKGIPFVLTEVDVPLDIGARLKVDPTKTQNDQVFTVIDQIEEAFPSIVAYTEQTVSAITPSPLVAEALEYPTHKPILRIERLYYSAEGKPIELAINHFNPELYNYRVKLKREQH